MTAPTRQINASVAWAFLHEVPVTGYGPRVITQEWLQLLNGDADYSDRSEMYRLRDFFKKEGFEPTPQVCLDTFDFCELRSIRVDLLLTSAPLLKEAGVLDISRLLTSRIHVIADLKIYLGNYLALSVYSRLQTAYQAYLPAMFKSNKE